LAGAKNNRGGKNKGIRFWTLKIFLITLFLSGGITLVAELFLGQMGLVAAVAVVVVLILLGILFDIIGVAFASCDQTPFIAMASRKVPRASQSLRLLKNADAVSSVCNDVIGDVCGIVSGAAGAAIVARLVMVAQSGWEIWLSVGISALVAACTVGGKAMGKKYAMRNNVKIVGMVGAICSLFTPKGRR